MANEIRAVTESISGEAARLGAMRGELGGSVGWLASSGQAAAETPAAGAFEEMTQDWIRVLGQFAEGVDELAAAVESAAWCYAVADQVSIPAGRGG